MIFQVIPAYDNGFKLGLLFEGVELAKTLSLNSDLVRIIDEVGPDKRMTIFGFHLEVFLILCYFDRILCLVLNIEGMLNIPLINKSKDKFVGIVTLVDVNPHVLHFRTSVLRTKFQGERSSSGSLAVEIVAGVFFSPIVYNYEEYFRQKVVRIEIVSIVNFQSEKLNFLEVKVLPILFMNGLAESKIQIYLISHLVFVIQQHFFSLLMKSTLMHRQNKLHATIRNFLLEFVRITNFSRSTTSTAPLLQLLHLSFSFLQHLVSPLLFL